MMMRFLVIALFVGALAVDAKRRYSVPDFKANWFKAQEYCASRNMVLATVGTRTKHDEIIEFIKTTDKFIPENRPRFWLGANDLAELWRFVWQSTGEEMTFSNWAKGEPNNDKKQEFCVEVVYDKGANINWQWNDQECRSFTNYFVCETPDCNC